MPRFVPPYGRKSKGVVHVPICVKCNGFLPALMDACGWVEDGGSKMFCNRKRLHPGDHCAADTACDYEDHNADKIHHPTHPNRFLSPFCHHCGAPIRSTEGTR